MFYEPIWEYEGHKLVGRPDTPNYAIYWKGPRDRRVRRQSTGTSDLEAAKRRLVEFVRERSTPKRQSPEHVLILDVLCDYIEVKTADAWRWTAPNTALAHLTRFTENENIETVAEFTLDAQKRYCDWRHENLLNAGYKASNATINRELSVVKAAMRSWWKRGLLENCPHVQLLPKPPPRDRFLRAHEVRRLIDACEAEHLRLYVMLALHTLQRPIAIYSLRTEQVDLEFNRIDFLPPGTTQSNKRRPVVPITPSLRPYLKQSIRHSVTGYILEWNGKPVQSVKRSFNAACDRAGLADMTPYTLRHTGATLMAAAGVPLRQIAGMLGHAEQRTTELYAKHHPDFLQAAASTLEQLFGEKHSARAGADSGGRRSKPWAS